MARPLRVEFSGAIYHVTSRMLGNWRRESNLLFQDDRDRLRFLERLGEGVRELEVRLYLVTLMAGTLEVGVEAFRQRRRDSALRGVAARMLCRYAGLSQREVAEELHIGSGSAVSRQLTTLKDRLAADRKLGKRVAAAERELEGRRRAS